MCACFGLLQAATSQEDQVTVHKCTLLQPVCSEQYTQRKRSPQLTHPALPSDMLRQPRHSCLPQAVLRGHPAGTVANPSVPAMLHISGMPCRFCSMLMRYARRSATADYEAACRQALESAIAAQPEQAILQPSPCSSHLPDSVHTACDTRSDCRHELNQSVLAQEAGTLHKPCCLRQVQAGPRCTYQECGYRVSGHQAVWHAGTGAAISFESPHNCSFIIVASAGCTQRP